MRYIVGVLVAGRRSRSECCSGTSKAARAS